MVQVRPMSLGFASTAPVELMAGFFRARNARLCRAMVHARFPARPVEDSATVANGVKPRFRRDTGLPDAGLQGGAEGNALAGQGFERSKQGIAGMGHPIGSRE